MRLKASFGHHASFPVRCDPLVQRLHADTQIASHLPSRQPTGQHDPHRVLAEFVPPFQAHGQSDLLHKMLSRGRHQTEIGPKYLGPDAVVLPRSATGETRPISA